MEVEIDLRECRSVAEFEAALPTPWSTNRHLYRGQANAAWSLSPGLFRIVSAPGRVWVNVERDAVTQFYRDARIHQPPDGGGPIAELALAQHFGVPTRLLDWTYSPVVALWFALNLTDRFGSEGEPAAVWMMDRLAVGVGGVPPGVATGGLLYGAGGGALDLLSPDVPAHVYDPPRFDGRIAAQDSVFTIHPLPADGLSFVPVEAVVATTKLVIPAECCLSVLAAVERNGTHAARLFPDLVGAARRSREAIRLAETTPWSVVREELQHRIGFFASEVRAGVWPFGFSAHDEMRSLRSKLITRGGGSGTALLPIVESLAVAIAGSVQEQFAGGPWQDTDSGYRVVALLEQLASGLGVEPV